MSESTFTVKARDLQGAIEATPWLEPFNTTRGERLARTLTDLVYAAEAVLGFDDSGLRETPLDVAVCYDPDMSTVSVSIQPTLQVVGEAASLTFDSAAS